jgi:hypothetical protein
MQRKSGLSMQMIRRKNRADKKTATGALQYTVRATDDRDNLLIISVKMKSLRNGQCYLY